MQTVQVNNALALETLEGLSAKPKYLSSKFFYDEAGSKIFQRIMQMPDYYLTNSEFEVFNSKAYDIIRNFCGVQKSIELIELGAGDGIKTKLLIKELYRQKINFRYIPIDISEDILIELDKNFTSEFNNINLDVKIGDYFEMMEEIEKLSATPKIILFLGSNIGNFSLDEGKAFFQHLRDIIRSHDKLFIGFDLKKDPTTILKAYNDSEGHTRDFNLNLLTRLNNELGANFNLKNFEHSPLYDPLNGVAKSYIVSKEEQEVYIHELNKTFHFKKWEAIYTEMSQKFDVELIEHMAHSAGFEIEKNFTDSNEYFLNSLWRPKKN